MWGAGAVSDGCNRYRDKRTLVALFALCVCLVLIVYCLTPLAGGELLDLHYSASQSTSIIQGLSDSQRLAHSLITAIPDTLFPIAYGLLFVGLTLEYYSKTPRWILLPACLSVVMDLLENAVQLFALNGFDQVLVLKQILTPAKFAFVAMSILIVILGFIRSRQL